MTAPANFVEKLRMDELDSAFRDVPRGARVLEVGAGAGWQARELSKRGFVVEAVDVAFGNYTAVRVWPVRDYDGRNLPFEADTFDIVFSSNVLEHVEDLPYLMRDMWRVLKPGGRMIHVVPSATWRLWTSLTYYPHLVRRAFQKLGGKRSAAMAGEGASADAPTPGRRKFHQLFLASVHGTAKSPLAELNEFRGAFWRRRFESLAGESLTRRPTHLLYTGYSILGAMLPVAVRRAVSRVLGSSCHIFEMAKARPGA